jgi:hypothetical protein
MTMFSMKPKFNLAEFLAVPAPVGAARSRGARRMGKPVQSHAPSAPATEPAVPSSETVKEDRET